MSSILIVGNVIKDVYLQLDERTTKLERDEQGTPWMDLAFDGGRYNYLHRTSVFAGAAVTLEVLKNFDLEAEIAGCKIGIQKGELAAPCRASNYRYILSRDDEIAYLTPSERRETVWQAPAEPVDWILVDRSANLSDQTAENILNYLKLASQTKLAVYVSAHQDEELSNIEKKLMKEAQLVFTEVDLARSETSGLVCKIAETSAQIGNLVKHWQRERDGLMTRLTMHSIVAGTVFAALVKGLSEEEALTMAKINLENSSLNGTLPYEKLSRLTQDAQEDNFLKYLAATLMTTGKGILAADESGGSIHKKFLAANIPDDEPHRRDYRNIFFTTPNLEDYVNGVILFDETARQKADDGSDFVSYLTNKGIIPGIKVDQGLEEFVDEPDTVAGEKYTKGLDDLLERLAEYYQMGLRFAKWRAAFEVTYGEDGARLTPTDTAIQKNCAILAAYAKDCQTAGIVPIVEPELVYDGDYGIDVAAELNSKIFDQLFAELNQAQVDLAGCILKCSMTLAGKRFALGPQSTPAEVGKATAEVLKAHVPAELAGVVFLSGGQSVEQATANLQAVTDNGPFPWPVTFSFARALQDPALDAWQGDNKNSEQARKAFAERLVANTKALKKSI